MQLGPCMRFRGGEIAPGETLYSKRKDNLGPGPRIL